MGHDQGMKKGEIMTICAIFKRVDSPLPCETAVKIAQFMRRTDEIVEEAHTRGGAILAAATEEGSDEAYEKARNELSELYAEEAPISLTLSQEELSGVDLTVEEAYELLKAGVLEEVEYEE